MDEVVRAIVALGGTYPDVVQALQQAKADGALEGRFEVDALPETGRAYDRVAAAAKIDGEVKQASATEEVATPRIDVATPLPDLFSRPK